jgi:hypothetical protein
MRRTLSARSTSFFRALPLLWVLAVAPCVWILRRESVILPMLLVTAVVPALLIRWQVRRLRHVSTDGERLYVRKGGREVAVPFSGITSVREIRGSASRGGVTVVLTLRDPEPLGPEVFFTPRMRWLPDREALRRAQSDPDGAARALWSGFSPAEEIRQRMAAAGVPVERTPEP